MYQTFLTRLELCINGIHILRSFNTIVVNCVRVVASAARWRFKSMRAQVLHAETVPGFCQFKRVDRLEAVGVWIFTQLYNTIKKYEN